MIEILEYIKKLDESGNYRLADKLDSEVRKIYAQTLGQTLGQTPDIPNYSDFLLKQMIQNQMTPKKDTDTLSPTKNTDLATLKKQMNNHAGQLANLQRDTKKLKTNQDLLPGLEGKVGKVSELADQFNTDITNNTNDISDNTDDIKFLLETNETPEE
jgi:predicted RNase H-like nuclease (RuvC/YqgF family)